MIKEHKNVGNVIEYVVEFYPPASHLLTLREHFLLLLRSMTEKVLTMRSHIFCKISHHLYIFVMIWDVQSNQVLIWV